MKKTFLAALLLSAGGLALAPLAHADLISIGGNLNGGSNATGSTGNGSATYSNSNAFGSGWSVQVISQGTPGIPQPELDSTTIDVSPAGAGTLNIFVTEQNVTGPLGIYNMESSFSSVHFNGPLTSVTLSTFIDPGDGLYATTDLLSSEKFTDAGGIDKFANTPNLSAPYSITEEFTIVAGAACTGAGNCNVDDGIDTSQVPEPGSLALLGTALIGIGAVGWSRRRRA